MKAILMVTPFIIGLGLLSCRPNPHALYNIDDVAIPLLTTRPSSERQIAARSSGVLDSKHFEINSHEMNIKASVDSTGWITIHDYPEEWRGKMSLVRFDGTRDKSRPPFSKSHCEEIRNMAVGGFGDIVRIAYRSVLRFDIPPFLASDFMADVRKSAQAVGINFPALILKNFIMPWKSSIELSFSEVAISRVLANETELSTQLHLGHKGGGDKDLKREIFVNSGDILCDLVSGDAMIKLKYPVVGDDRFVTVIYDLLEIEL